MNIEKTYIYGNSQILAQHDGAHTASRYFYLHDRLGSVRQVIDTMSKVVDHYTYRPFGELYPAPDFEETVTNPFKFTGQFYDFEINEYYLRARMYDPHIGRFTSRDPVRGKFREPLTLHVYLYCLNDPSNRTDPSGEFAGILMSMLSSTWVRAKDAGSSAWGYMKGREAITHIAAFMNANYTGFMNAWTGPDSVGNEALFGIGFVAGAAEIYTGEKFGASVGGAVSEAITSTFNEWASDNPWSWGSAGRILKHTIKGALVGKIAEKYDPDTAAENITLFLLSFNRQAWEKNTKDLLEWFDSMKY